MPVTRLRPTPVIFTRIAALLLIAALLSGCSFLQERRHRAVLDRIAKHLQAKNPTTSAVPEIEYIVHSPSAWPKPEIARAMIIRSLGVGLFNEFWHSRRCDQGKLQAVLDRLDANNGADLNTVEGSLQIFELMLQVTPTARDYTPFAVILGAQAVDNFPKLGGPIEKPDPPAPSRR